MHAGLQCPNGDIAEGGKEVLELAKELSELKEAGTDQADVALVFDYASAWAWDTQAQGQDFDYFRLVYDFYRGLRRLGLSIDILRRTHKISQIKKLCAYQVYFLGRQSLKTALESFDGQVVIGPRTGSKTDAFKIPKCLPPEIDGFDCKVTSVEVLTPKRSDSLIIKRSLSYLG